MKSIIASCLSLILLAGPLFAQGEGEAKKTKPWKNELELSYVSTNGNSKTSTTAGRNLFSYAWSKTLLELEAGGMGSQTQSHTTAEQYFASEKLSYKLTDRNYIFEKGKWDKDRFAGIRNRYDANAGFGRELWKTPKNLLIGELGGGYISEERVNAPRNDFASGRAYSKYTLTISETANFSQDAEYLANFEDSDDFRVNTETALITTISTYFSLKVSYKWKHVGVPPPGFGRNDTTTAVALISKF